MEGIIKRQKMLEQVVDYQSVINGKEKFIDQQFQPFFNSIFSDKQTIFVWDGNKDRKQFEADVRWRRLSILYGEDNITVAENVTSEDVKQGTLGNWYLMSILGSIADKWPEQIQNLFITKQVNANGCYALRLMINGHYTTMVLDDFVPYDTESYQLIYAQKVTKNIWPILIEKAFAKFNGSYEDIVMGSSEFIKFLLPYPMHNDIRKFEESEKLEQWNLIKSKLTENWVITWKTFSENPKHSKYEKVGLNKEQDYFITNLYQPDKKNKILKLSNPLGIQNWKGKWWDEDSSWDDYFKEIFDFDGRLPGEFFISFEDYLRYFEYTQIWLPVLDLEK